MECPGCGVENPDGSAFCKECGGPLTAGEAGQSPPEPTFPAVSGEASQEAPGTPAYESPTQVPKRDVPPGTPAFPVPPGAPPYQPPPGAPYRDAAQAPIAQQPFYQPVVLATQPVYVGPRSDGLCIAGMVLGIVGLVLFWIPILPIACGILGVVFGGIGVKNVQQKPGELIGGGMGVAGIVTGILAVVGGIVMLVVYFAVS